MKKDFPSLFILAIVLLTSLLPITLAADFTVKQNDVIDIKIPCYDNNNAPCISTTICNITIFNPNQTLVNNQRMTWNPAFFNYTVTNTQNLQTYSGTDSCIGGLTYGYTTFSLQITPTGGTLDTGKSIGYILIFVVAFIVFLGFLIIGISLPISNKKDEMTGYVLAVSNLKYFKIFCLAISYLVAMFISYFAWMVCAAYLEMNFLTSMFQVLFTIQVVLVLPLFILFVYLILANWVRDAQISDMLSRGFSRVK
jgi:hypothetical protein